MSEKKVSMSKFRFSAFVRNITTTKLVSVSLFPFCHTCLKTSTKKLSNNPLHSSLATLFIAFFSLLFDCDPSNTTKTKVQNIHPSRLRLFLRIIWLYSPLSCRGLLLFSLLLKSLRITARCLVRAIPRLTLLPPDEFLPNGDPCRVVTDPSASYLI